MSNRYTSDGKRRSSQTHARRRHVCKCGRKVNGNAYYAHRKACRSRLLDGGKEGE